jgi:hypothetical protein
MGTALLISFSFCAVVIALLMLKTKDRAKIVPFDKNYKTKKAS